MRIRSKHVVVLYGTSTAAFTAGVYFNNGGLGGALIALGISLVLGAFFALMLIVLHEDGDQW